MPETTREFVEKLLLKTETGVHRYGWDQPAFVSILHWLPGDRLALMQTPITFSDMQIGETLDYYGEKFLTDKISAQLADELNDTFFGFAMISEAYSYEGPTDKLRALHAAGTHMADVPGAKEIRVVSAVDIHGRAYYIQRIRGEKPSSRQAGDGWTMGGLIYDGLRKMVQAVVQHLPDNENNLAGLAELAREAKRHDQILEGVNEEPQPTS